MCIKVKSRMAANRRSRNKWRSVLLLAVLCLGVSKEVKGDCIDASGSYINNTVWRPDLCTVCTCEDPVPVCELVLCKDPKCDYSQGEKLELLPTQCCPFCSGRREPCDFNGQLVAHGTQWTPSSCENCHCNDGRVECSNTTCPHVPCRPDEVKQNVPGQCCSRCIPTGGPCMDNFGVRRLDGDVWSPLTCVRCLCRNGHVQCMPARCPSLQCADGMQAVEKRGQCCPVCETVVCHQAGQSYQEGEIWKGDACTSCTCHHGHLTCSTRQCSGNLTCVQSHVQSHRDGECCSQCVPKEGICVDEKKKVHYHGDMWKSAPCEFCGCSHGYIKCRNVRCGKVSCTGDQVLTTVPNECCPICTYPITCAHEGQIYQIRRSNSWHPCNPKWRRLFTERQGTCLDRRTKHDPTPSGDYPHGSLKTCTWEPNDVVREADEKCYTNGQMWTPDDCSVCECQNGKTQCYRKTCPVCSSVPTRAESDAKREDCCDTCERTTNADDKHPVSQFPAFNNDVRPHASISLTVNEPLLAAAGETTQITTNVLDVSADDGPGDVIFTLLDGPLYGQFVATEEETIVHEFTLQDLMSGNIAYKHRGNSSVNGDLARLRVADRHHRITILLSVKVQSQTSRAPVVTTNVGGLIHRGDTLQISSELLKTDVEISDSSQVQDAIYTLVPPRGNPKHGDLVMMVPTPVEGPGTGWTMMGDGMMGTRMVRFRQRDIDEGRIYYKHSGTDLPSDRFTFEVADASSPDNVLRDQAFDITITDDKPQAMIHPMIIPGTKLGLTVMENQITPITPGHLAFSDMNSSPENLVYKIVSPLREEDEGTVEHVDVPFSSLLQFTQADVNNRHVIYRPPDEDIGEEEREVSFTFVVVSGGETRHGPEYKFTIRILPVNNNPPFFLNPNPEVTMSTGGTYSLYASLLEVADPDNKIEDLEIIIKKTPNNGVLEKLGEGTKIVVNSGDKFAYSDILNSTLQYTHSGAAPTQDELSLVVSDGPHRTENIIYFNIIKLDKSIPTVLSSATFQINITEGETEIITREQIAFADVDSLDNHIRIILMSHTSQGHFQVKRSSGVDKIGLGDSFTQAEVNEGQVSFIADTEIGLKLVSELVYVYVSDSSGNVLPSQIVSLHIIPMDNLPPTFITGADMQVEEGGEAALTTQMISVVDVDSAIAQVIFVVERPPHFGILQNRKLAIGSESLTDTLQFAYTDVIEGHIYYLQSDHKNMEPDQDAFLFSVNDGKNRSPVDIFNISIQLVNDEQPKAVTEQLFVGEGKTVAVTNQTIYVVDLDTPPKDLIFTIINMPMHGTLLKKELFQDPVEEAFLMQEKSTFSYQDVLNNVITYSHDDSETTKDSVVLHLTDGEFDDTVTLNVIIGLVSDETPRASVNRGLRVQAGTTTVITQQDLQASDLDSESSQIVYTITKDPSSGHLEFSNGQISYLLSAVSVSKTFKQSDINKGYISFVHTIGEKTGNILFKFKLSDPEGNDLIDQDFFITVLDDYRPPFVISNKEFTVTEGAREKLTTNFLSFSDIDTEPGSLSYTVMEGPDLGHLELLDQPGVPVVTFTQADLAANKVIYVHTSTRELAMDQFTFAVSDGKNKIVQVFFINIQPVDDAIPALSNNGLRVQEGVRKLITEFDLKAVDQDTKEHMILFTVVKPAEHGSLDLYTSGSYRTAEIFTMEDIYENRVSYQHGGGETTQDSFTFLVSDGTNRLFTLQQSSPANRPLEIPQTFAITILLVDDGVPIIERNLGLQYLESQGSQVGKVITSKELFVTDEDTPSDDIMYIVTSLPKFGFLENTRHPGKHIKSFTQKDINIADIRYRMNRDSSNLQDSFDFDVMDRKPNLVPGNRFHITWSEISLGQPVFNITETQRVLQVPVVRRGNLKQYCVVECATFPGTATSRTDMSRPGLQDFILTSGQVQFDSWQDSKTCTVIINDDSVYEGPEIFYVHISSPTFAVLGDVRKAAVTVNDDEDQPMLQFISDVIQVNESDDHAVAAIIRSGDISDSVSVICSTRSLTATGSSLTSLESGSDYISRGYSSAHRVIFPPGVTHANCSVKLIDDSMYERAEQFELQLSDPSIPATLGALTASLVVIDGPNDVSHVFLAYDAYAFPENSGTVDLEVVRVGSDLSHPTMVWCATRMSSTVSATPGQDYIPSSTQLTFGPGQTSNICHVVLLDDDFEPTLEGKETFEVFLSSAVGSILDQPHFAVVTIYDDHLDIPQITFSQDIFVVDEKNQTVNATILRSGDAMIESSVICYTQQLTAEVATDFDERPFSNDSRIVFKHGERSKFCVVNILDDDEFEQNEVFQLKLASPMGSNGVTATLGQLSTAVVTITNYDDVPTIQFEQSAYSVHEPSVVDQIATVRVKVIRTGSVNETSSVRCSTRDGSAQSGSDYNPKSLVLMFEPGVRDIEFSVDVLYNTDVEWHQSFKIQLGPEEPTGSIFGSMTIITITVLDNEVSGSLVLPAAPMVISLLHYGNSEQGLNTNPSPGYPLVCVTPCDVKYPDYTSTASLCEDSGINQTSIIYQWEMAMPQSDEGASPLFVKVTDKTLFTSVDNQVLDSVYFRPHFQVRCVAQPLQENGNPGIPLRSRSTTIGTNPICKSTAFPSSHQFAYQAQSFLASLEYIPPDRAQHGNTVHISVQIPHQDGMLPLISTHPLNNLRFLLSESVYRQQHVCSNIIMAKERPPFLDQGFLGDLHLLDETKQDDDEGQKIHGPGFDFRYQFDKDLRETQSLLIYRHLNLKSCIWKFDAWYHMTELVDLCGGRIVSDFQIMDKSDSHLTIRVPLYVSYVYATAPTGWGSLEHRTEMEVSFYYSTVLWKTGLATEGRNEGRLQVVRILIGDDKKLVLEFRTQAKFRGQFVLQHHTLPGVESRIVASVPLATSFHLDLVWSQNTFDSPYQVWKAISQYSLKDYTGIYHIELIPCLASQTQMFIKSDILPCVAQQPQRFEVPISFQQTNHPVPVIYSLNTEFQLTNNLKLFLLNPATKGMENEDWNFSGVFSKGQKLYGRVLWNPEQDLKTFYKLILQKVYLCTGTDGFIPTYDPTGETYDYGPQYGCIQPSKKLLHRFLILDRESPDMTHLNFHQVPFNAQFVVENELYSEVAAMPGVDGFVMDIDPLYQVGSGYQWYLQVVYTIGSTDTPGYRIRRSLVHFPSSLAASSFNQFLSPQLSTLELTSLSSSSHAPLKRVKNTRYKREIRNASKEKLANEKDKAGKPDNSEIHADESHKNGTNMKHFHLIHVKAVSDSSLAIPITAIVAPIFLVIIFFFSVTFICLRKRRRKQRDFAAEKTPVTRNNFPVVTNSQSQRYRFSNSTDSIEETSKQVSNKSENRNSVSSLSKFNIIRIKDSNIKSQYGNNVENGTEV